MKSIFSSTKNTRPILEGSLRFVRSDVPTAVSEYERLWLIENRLTTIVDLRTDDERERKRCPLALDGRFDYHPMPVTGGGAIPPSVSAVASSYIAMADEGLLLTARFMLDCKGGVLYFCNAGKDRTGVLSAILLRTLGYDDDYIVTDYMKSKENLSEMLKAFAEENPKLDVNIITPREDYIRDFLAWYEMGEDYEA